MITRIIIAGILAIIAYTILMGVDYDGRTRLYNLTHDIHAEDSIAFDKQLKYNDSVLVSQKIKLDKMNKQIDSMGW